jgi:hypothetical protein
MGTTTHSIEVNAPLRVVYNQWTQFEEFPRFMEGVAEVRQEGPNKLFWKAKIAGKDKQWEAEITEQIPDKRIAWASIDGTRNAGEVNFESLETERTLITLTMEYEPEGFLEKAGDLLGIPSGQVEGDLNHFRDYIEQNGKETGGWRGQIGGEESLSSSFASAIEVGHESAHRTGVAVEEESPAGVSAKKGGYSTDWPEEQSEKTLESRQEANGMIDKPIPVSLQQPNEPTGIVADERSKAGGIQLEPADSFEETTGSFETAKLHSDPLDQPIGLKHFSDPTGVDPKEEGAFDTMETESAKTFQNAEFPLAEPASLSTARSDETVEDEGELFPSGHATGAIDKPLESPGKLTSDYQVDDDWAELGVPTNEEIARRAYELYLERGQIPGHHDEDWAQAEKELSGKIWRK